MGMKLNVHLLPDSLTQADLSGSAAVVIDVLRASTTIAHALVCGAPCVVPADSIESARETAANSERQVVLGGERGGVRIEGFDFGNSPFEYTEQSVGGKSVVFTTTNGTRAMLMSASAERILVGSFVNQQSILEELRGWGGPIHLVCAGTNGSISGEDVLFAGSLARGIAATGGQCVEVNDEARIAMDFFRTNSGRLLDTIRASYGGRNLIKLGYDRDIERAASVDWCRIVPEFDAASGEIRGLSDSC